MQEQTQKVPNVLPLETIQKIVDTQDWVKLVQKRQRILITLQALRNDFEDKVQSYLEKDVMPKVYDLIDQYLIKNDLSLLGFYNLDVISACVVDKQQYSEFVNGDRYEPPKLKWEQFVELQEILKKEMNAKIVGSKNPQGNPTWTIRTNISQELLDEYAPVKKLIETVKAKYLEIDQANAKKSEDVKEESAYKEISIEEKNEVEDNLKKEEVGEVEENTEFKEEPEEAPGLEIKK
jgi:hypothetical protein